jgi:hypothetical protein
MTYALYIDESGNFKENNMTLSGRISIVGGWMAKNDDDHNKLRQQLNHWYDTLSGLAEKKLFHATEWRKYKRGREILSQVFSLCNGLKPHSIAFMENRSSNLPEHADSTYLDMLVELIVNTIFHLLDTRCDTEAFPLQVYVAERKGVPDWEIKKLVQYRLRAILSGSRYHHKVDPHRVCDIYSKSLKKSPDLINNAQSRSRDKQGLMPELILADFICNSLYQMDHFQNRPSELTACAWHPSIYIPDPFWNEIQTYKNHNRWVELLVTMVSRRSQEWVNQNQAMSKAYAALLNETISHVVANLAAVQQLNASLSKMIHHTRDFTHAEAIICTIEKWPKKIPRHLVQTLKWYHSIFKLSIANHQGDNKRAAACFQEFTALFETPAYQRIEFFQTVSDNYNRHAVATTDRYAFEKTEKVLQSAIAAEKSFLNTSFKIQDQTFNAQKSDTLGKIFSTLGQLYTKQTYREPGKAVQALACFDEAEHHMQQSLDPKRQRNYRIEALLLSENTETADKIFALLNQDSDISPESLFSKMGYNSFNTMYWLRWMLIPKNKPANPYKKILIKNHLPQFRDLDGKDYPQMSILYYVGQLAWAYNKKSAAINAWNKAAAPGRDIKYAGVLQTLALRPLCELILNSRDDTARASDTASLKTIISRIQTGGFINPDYFKKYFSMLENTDISRDILKQLQKDIPYS